MPCGCPVHKTDRIEFKRMQIRQSAQFAEKVRLENILNRELRPLFNQVLSDFRTTVAAFGTPPNAGQFRPRFESVLSNHYQRVQRAFKNVIIEDNGGKAFFNIVCKQDENQRNTLIDLALLEFRNQGATNQAILISQTNERQARQAIQLARQQIIDDGGDLEPTALALAASVILSRNLFVRSNTIAITETQWAAEATKSITASVSAGNAPFNLGQEFRVPTDTPVDITKRWDDRDDNRVRDTHKAVDQTTLPEDGVFIVGSSRLRFPRDASFGAAIREVINCRCEANYSFA